MTFHQSLLFIIRLSKYTHTHCERASSMEAPTTGSQFSACVLLLLDQPGSKLLRTIISIVIGSHDDDDGGGGLRARELA